MTTGNDVATLWMWPWTALRCARDWGETFTSAREVIEARLPMIAEIWSNPFGADYPELSLMVTEKSDAFAQSHRSLGSAQAKIRRASDANARAFGRLMGGELLGLTEWTRIIERNLEIAATLAAVPVAALKPVHAKATANARRLNRA